MSVIVPEIEWNKRVWDGAYNWNDAGDEWSSAWGSANAQWSWSLLPRIGKYLPNDTTLELGPGYGRWSQFLVKNTSKLLLVDISSKCIAACKKRFDSYDNVEYYKSDGSSLEMIEDNSVDFVFSFDSLVHVEIDILERYLQQLASKMTSNGVAVIHHSNLGSFRYFAVLRKIEKILKLKGSIYEVPSVATTRNKKSGLFGRLLSLFAIFAMRLKIIDRTHMRALSTSASRFKAIAEKHGFVCVSQEIIKWGTSRRPIDCISIVTKAKSKWATHNELLINNDFMIEAKYVKKLSRAYRD